MREERDIEVLHERGQAVCRDCEVVLRLRGELLALLLLPHLFTVDAIHDFRPTLLLLLKARALRRPRSRQVGIYR